MKKIPEEKLLPLVMKGDSKALIYLEHKAAQGLKRFLKENGGKRQELNDLLQEAYVILFQNLSAGKYTSKNLVAYYKAIAKNIWLKSIRKRVPFKDFDKSEWEKLSENDVPIFEHARLWVHYNDLIDSLRNVLLKMDEKCQQYIRWRKLEGKTSEEIAATLTHIQKGSIDVTVISLI